MTNVEDNIAAAEVTAAVYERSMESVKHLIAESMLTAERTTLLLGRVVGDPVACGRLIRISDVASVYNICVTEAFRRQGIGEAMTRALLRTGHDSRAEVGVLQSTRIVYSVYERIGFETVVTYHLFHPTE